MIDQETKAKIKSLQQQIDELYKEARSRPSNMNCDICGKGDMTTKHGKIFKVKSPVHGYERRPSESPKLCHNHAVGWSLSQDSYDPFGKRSSEEIDLHFTQFIAKQIIKESNEVNKQTQPS